MKRRHFLIGMVGFIISAMLAIAALGAQSVVAQTAPDLGFSKFRVSTSGQYFELKSGALGVDMSRVQLAYYNHYDLAKATSSKLVSLTGELAPNSYYLVNDGALTLCYQQTVASASLGFSTTNGMVQLLLLEQSEIGGQFTSKVLDSVAWSKTQSTHSNVQTLVAGPSTFFQKTDSGWASYRQSASDACTYEYEVEGETVQSLEEYLFLPSSTPPVRHLAATTKSTNKANRNTGKMAPVVNELLPNPASPQTDAEDEFIELYNTNDADFDLSGFKLAFGSTKPRKYTFPEGTILKPKEFRAFTSGGTSISLSNTKAQVWLLDPNEKIIGQSEPYSKAKDGQAWALDGDKWVWTSRPSPGEMNTLSPVLISDAKSKSAAAVLGMSSNGDSNGSAAAGNSSASKLDDAAPLHPLVLAVVGAAAVGYALYEYRVDAANRIHQLRRYIRHRRALRSEV